MQQRRIVRLVTRIAGLGMLVSLLGAVPSAGASAVAVSPFTYTGDAFGTEATVGANITSGPTAFVTLGCATQADVHKSNTVATVSDAPLINSGTVTTTASTSAVPLQSRTTARTEGLSLLNGLVTADAVVAVSTSTNTAGVFSVDGSESTLVNLHINGDLITASPAPNTRIDLPLGLGFVVLNEQTSSLRPKGATLTVNMIHVFIQASTPLFTAGTEVIVSHAKSDLEGPFNGTLDGHAFGTRVDALDNLIRSGPSALVILPCRGTNGEVRTNSTAAVTLANVPLATGSVVDTAQGKLGTHGATGETTSTVQALDFLTSVVTATVVKADAHASTNGSTFTFSDAGSTFANLSVAGHPEITAAVAPNTQIALAGLGTLFLHRIVRTPNSIEVRMIQLDITSPLAGLPIGTSVRVAVAEASVH